MRVWAALLALMLGVPVALAQGDPRENYGPSSAAATKAKAGSRAKSAPKAEPKTARNSQPAKPAPRAASKDEKPETDKSPAKKQADKAKAAKLATPEKPTTTGSAGAASAAAKATGPRELFMAMPLADRLAVQSALTWSGDFKASNDGEFSDKLVEAAKDYQKRAKSKVTGMLTPDEVKTIAASIAPRQSEAGWRVVDDPATGARVGVPARFATKITPLPAGTRWSSEQGQLQIETFRIDTGATIEAVFEQQKQMPRRRITYQNLQGDTFVIAGMQGLKKMRVTATVRDNEVRGLTILYDQAMEGSIDPVLSPLAWAFVPFTRGFALAGADSAPRRKVEYGTGIFVSSAGHVLTARRLTDGCNVITLPGLGHAERVAEDRAADLALLRVHGASNIGPVPLGDASAPGEVTLTGVADPQAQGGGGAVSSMKARIGGAGGANALDPSPATGFTGAAALDAGGKLAGMVQLQTMVTTSAGAAAPTAAIVPADVIRGFLAANSVTPDAAAKSGDAQPSVTRVICVRK